MASDVGDRRQMSLVGFMQAGSTTVYSGLVAPPRHRARLPRPELLPEARADPRGGLLRHDVLRRPPRHARHLRRVGGRGGAARRPPGEARPQHRARPDRRASPARSVSARPTRRPTTRPFHVARTFATLDHLSGGRAAWNVVTSVNDSEAQNYGIDDRTSATTSATTGPTSSSRPPPGCGTRGRTTPWCSTATGGTFADPDKVHELGYHGEYFDVRGPLTVPRTPAGPAGPAPGRVVGPGPRLRGPLGRADLHRRPRHRGRPVALQGPEGPHRRGRPRPRDR